MVEISSKHSNQNFWLISNFSPKFYVLGKYWQPCITFHDIKWYHLWLRLKWNPIWKLIWGPLRVSSVILCKGIGNWYGTRLEEGIRNTQYKERKNQPKKRFLANVGKKMDIIALHSLIDIEWHPLWLWLIRKFFLKCLPDEIKVENETLRLIEKRKSN